MCLPPPGRLLSEACILAVAPWSWRHLTIALGHGSTEWGAWVELGPPTSGLPHTGPVSTASKTRCSHGCPFRAVSDWCSLSLHYSFQKLRRSAFHKWGIFFLSTPTAVTPFKFIFIFSDSHTVSWDGHKFNHGTQTNSGET